jgi:hypothetical protein
MSPIFASTPAYQSIRERALPRDIEETLAALRITTPRELLKYSGSAPVAARVGEAYQGKLSPLLSSSGSAEMQVRFALQHAAILAPLLVRPDTVLSENEGRSAIAYAISEASARLNRSSWGWRSEEAFTRFDCSMDGDVSVRQAPLSQSGQEAEPELVDVGYRGFTLSQDSSPLLVAALRFAKHIGSLDLPEISEHRQVIAQVRNSFWGNPSYSSPQAPQSCECRNACELRLVGELDCTDSNYFTFDANLGRHYLPRIDGERLEFLRFAEAGDTLAPEFPERKFVRDVVFSRVDLPELFVGIYRTFARSPDLMAEILAAFVPE